MGQTMNIRATRAIDAHTVRFEVDRSLTGMAHESFFNAADAVGDRPAARLARALFATAPLAAVHLFSNLVTITLSSSHSATVQPGNAVIDELSVAIKELFVHYHPGVLPTAVVTGDDL